MDKNNSQRREGRNPWPIVITAYYIVFFCALMAFVAYASTQHVDLVRSDYYEEELRFQQQLERVNRTRELAQPLAITFDPVRRSIALQLPVAHVGQSSGRVHLYRPSDARLDQDLPLATDAKGKQEVGAAQLRAGLWKIRVLWTVAGQEYSCDQPIVIRPAGSHGS